uniref:IgGFc-binding protein N-terminal domain-containing protein n=1 Tax=Parascaris univalens TaxID=6257 RepID=A0A915AEV9_PARUN
RQCVRCIFAMLMWLTSGPYSCPLEGSSFDSGTTSRIEVTLSTAQPGSLIDLRQIRSGGAWYVNSPGGILQLFAIGTLISADEVSIIVNGSSVLYNTSEFLNSNDFITVTTRQIIVRYPDQVHKGTNVLYYVRDVNLRRSDCGDPLVIANVDTNMSFSNDISWSCDCAVTIISLTEAADDFYTIAFTNLSTTSITTSPALIIAGIYQKWFSDDIILFTISSSDARRWQTLPILQRIVTIVVPIGAIVNGSVSAAYVPVYDRRVHLGDMGIISSRNYPVATSPGDLDVNHRLTASSPIPFVMDIVRADIQSNAMLSIFTYPPITIRKSATNRTGRRRNFD